MDFIIRLQGELDQAMTLFQLRRLGAEGEFILPPKGGSDVQIVGKVPDDKLDGLIEAFADKAGALHAGDRHVRLGGDAFPSIEQAEAHLGGPFTIPGTTRATWSFGGDVADHLVQVLYGHPEHIPVTQLRAEMDIGIEAVVPALKQLSADGTVRKFRAEDGSDTYGLARAVRDRLDAVLAPTAAQ